MSETNYFWQGRRKIEVRKDDAAVTIHAASEAEARSAAARAGVELRAAAPAGPGLVQAEVVGERDSSVDRLRASRNVVHHVYRDQQAPGNEYLITESFFIKFKPETPEDRILAYFSAEHLVVERAMGDKTYLVRVTDATGRNPIRAANAAASRDDVEYAEPNLIRRLTRFFTSRPIRSSRSNGTFTPRWRSRRTWSPVPESSRRRRGTSRAAGGTS